MNSKTELPLSLYKANLELQVKIGRLIQESGQQWLDYGNRLIGDSIAESNAEMDELLQAQDWQQLASLPAESLWRQLQQRVGDSQAVAQIAVNAQNAFASGLQQILQDWQYETTHLLGQEASLMPSVPEGWDDLVKPWEELLQATGMTAVAPKPAAKKKAAAKKAPAKKAASRKAVAKKAPAKKAAKRSR
ncbi:phasin family protein [Pseudoxanthomonas kalamensis]|uniref:phasin family protein n=1 Tax=Pseudoxanthomonas kalamensis TaxID=289483 RepID=UPI001B85EE08|nr:phasin family protein [Pseudoxanthomonas kalamensis]